LSFARWFGITIFVLEIEIAIEIAIVIAFRILIFAKIDF
jgi:hypothetical protein